MTITKPAARHAPASIALHWLMFLLLVAVYATIELREYFPKGSGPREALKAWHFTAGLTVFALVWLRLIIRLLKPPLLILPRLSKWQRHVSNGVHIALYVFMIGMPLLGWLSLSAEGKLLRWFGIHIPALVGRDDAFAERIGELHETIGSAGYVLIGFHAAAALFHHYVLKDDVLMRMFPWRSRARSEAKVKA
ncbi:cytochrome b [Sphingosinicella rhizophila]|uniref:Cytochrome b n=1 Tax=Sphingosinicella rhizophila TaxID=3050082 RepID=A0ABU3QC87_9SPHN|nr:cytochrome b [Sphingosinicella sp. GR2756]MDT9600887.1 cytochrome b [Sphingosinicella sp. GR2756]